MIRRPPIPPLFPYTTLSRPVGSSRSSADTGGEPPIMSPAWTVIECSAPTRALARLRYAPSAATPPAGRRSEEHTSELQSRQYLVCRLLLEKKNTNHKQTRNT